MASLLIISLIAFALFLFISGYGIMHDYSSLLLKQGRELFRGQGVSYYSELAVTLVITLVIALSIALL